MRIIVVGGKGTIGSAVVKELGQRHEIVVVGKERGDLLCDVTVEDFLEPLFNQIGPFDALLSTMGQVHFADLAHMNSAKYRIGLEDKLMGQVNLVLVGLRSIRDGGSFTLTSGVLNQDPIRTGSSAAMVNGAIEGFVKGIAIEMPRQVRINVVSPTVVSESMSIYAPYFRGFESVPAERVALAYSKSVEGLQTGQVYRVL